jgi:UDP-2,3-diacylglucosamine hydrolase
LRDKEDAPYRRLRAVLRNPLAIRIFRWIHPDIATWIALRTSHTSRNMRPRDRGAGLARIANDRLTTDPSLELYVYGHSHAPVVGFAAKGGAFANPGAWMDAPTFLCITDERVELATLDRDDVRVMETIEKRPRTAEGD